MFVAAIAKPVPERKFDGKAGIWRVASPYIAQKSSQYHAKGDTYMKDVSLDAEWFQMGGKEVGACDMR